MLAALRVTNNRCSTFASSQRLRRGHGDVPKYRPLLIRGIMRLLSSHVTVLDYSAHSPDNFVPRINLPYLTLPYLVDAHGRSYTCPRSTVYFMTSMPRGCMVFWKTDIVACAHSDAQGKKRLTEGTWLGHLATMGIYTRFCRVRARRMRPSPRRRHFHLNRHPKHQIVQESQEH